MRPAPDGGTTYVYVRTADGATFARVRVIVFGMGTAYYIDKLSLREGIKLESQYLRGTHAYVYGEQDCHFE